MQVVVQSTRMSFRTKIVVKCECLGCVVTIGKASPELACLGIPLLPKPKSSPCKSDPAHRTHRYKWTRLGGLSTSQLGKRRNPFFCNLGDCTMIPRSPVFILHADQFMNFPQCKDPIGISNFHPFPTNVLEIGLPIFATRACLCVIPIDIQAVPCRILDGLIQTSVYGIVGPKEGLHKIGPRVQHPGKDCTHLTQHLAKVFAAMRARDTTLKLIQPLRNKLFFRRRRVFGVQGRHRMKCHPTQWTPDGRHCSTKRNHSRFHSALQHFTENRRRRLRIV